MELLKLMMLMISIHCCHWQSASAQLPPGVLLDLNAQDNSTLDYTNEYFDLDTPVFLSDPNNTDMMTLFSTDQANWMTIYLLVFNGVVTHDEADLFFPAALSLGRVGANYQGLYTRSQLGPGSLPSGLVNFDPNSFTGGMRIAENNFDVRSDMDGELNETEVELALQAIAFESAVHPGYSPRVACIVAEDPINTTAACVTLYFIGRNDDPPFINYTASSNVSFSEGQPDPVPIVSGSLVVSDPDHPTRYQIQSARAVIRDYTAGDSEYLAVTYELPGLTYQFNEGSGVLTVTGEATADVYTELLNNITYFNNMSEPFATYRTIEVSVSDGIFTSNQQDIVVTIVNVNDVPAISLNGADPLITRLQFDYTEGSGLVAVATNATVVDPDPNARIQRLQISLVNPIDGDSELISLATPDLLGLTIYDSDPHTIIITGIADRDDYTTVLRTLSYNHSDSDPGNPTIIPREIEFSIEDDRNATNVVNSTLLINIIPVNDLPILLYVSDTLQRASPAPVLFGETFAMFNYTEDDPPINFGRDIYLRDVDGNVTSATLTLTGFIDGTQDHILVDQSLLVNTRLRTSRTRNDIDDDVFTIEGEATPYVYEEVLRSLSYQNLFSTNQVTDGFRNITIATQDDGGLNSSSIYAVVMVMDRNDGPKIDVGGGLGEDHTVTFVENGRAVGIVQSHLLDVMDEELDNISSLSLTLMALNGDLDEGETIYIRSPMVDLVPFFVPPYLETSVSIAVNQTVGFYENILRYAYYYNPKDEPTIFNATGAMLTRVVVIQITDGNFVESGVDPNAPFNGDSGVTMTTMNVFVRIEPVNDNRPRILITAEPGGCAVDSSAQTATNENANRRRRDLKAVSRIRKRSVGSSIADQSMAPKLTSSQASFTQLETQKCLQSIQLVFNVNTSVPVIQVSKLLDQLMTFDPPELNRVQKVGVWMDYRTMVVFFKECFPWPTGGGAERIVNVVFESERGSCSWSSSCEEGICFHNNTGCSLTGYYPINTSTCDNTSTVSHDGEPSTDASLQEKLYPKAFLVIFGSTLVLLVVFVTAVSVWKGLQKRNQAAASQGKARTQSPLPTLTTYAPQPTTITMTPPTKDNKTISSEHQKSFVQDLEVPNKEHHDRQSHEPSATKDSHMTSIQTCSGDQLPSGRKSRKNARKRNVVAKQVPKTSLTSSDSVTEKESLLSDELEGEEDVEGSKVRLRGDDASSCDQSCDQCIHDNDSGMPSTTTHTTNDSIDNRSSNSGHCNHSDRVPRPSNSRQNTPIDTKTMKQHSEH